MEQLQGECQNRVLFRKAEPSARPCFPPGSLVGSPQTINEFAFFFLPHPTANPHLDSIFSPTLTPGHESHPHQGIVCPEERGQQAGWVVQSRSLQRSPERLVGHFPHRPFPPVDHHSIPTTPPPPPKSKGPILVCLAAITKYHSSGGWKAKAKARTVCFLLRPLSVACCVLTWPFPCVSIPDLSVCPILLLLQGHKPDWTRAHTSSLILCVHY